MTGSDWNHCSDEELLAHVKNGQRDAFGTLVRRYTGELFGYLRRYLGNADLAEDVFQNTFLQVFLKMEQFEDGRRVRPWLYTLATNQAIDTLRRLGRRPAVSLDQPGPDRRAPEGGLAEVLEEAQPGPVDQVEGEERRALVRRHVDELPDFLRQVVLLAFYQGLKYQEVGEILGIPVGTVKSRMHTALNRLQDTFGTVEALREP